MKELWDLYDSNCNKLNKKVYRGEKLSDDEYHIVVNAWVKKDDKFLITERAAIKTFPFTNSVTTCSDSLGDYQ